jgi:prepilin-type N-terminal cleavage/methylation domain-containing protein
LSGQNRQDGFTILEVMVALVIAATASAIIFSHLRALVDLNIRVRQHQQDVTITLNEAAYLLAPDWGQQARFSLTDREVAIALRDKFSPSLFVSNFSLEAKDDLPSVSRAFTPYQVYRVQPGKRYDVSLLFPNLPLDL